MNMLSASPGPQLECKHAQELVWAGMRSTRKLDAALWASCAGAATPRSIVS